MRKWWETKRAAWGEILMSLALGALATYIIPQVGIPLFIILLLVGIWLLIRAYKSGGASSEGDYVDKIIVDSKIPAVLEITNTLQKMADYQNIVLNKLLRKKVKKNKLAKIQKMAQTRLDIKPRDPHLGNEVKIKLIKKQMKRMGLLTLPRH
jgi:hypothetical protein